MLAADGRCWPWRCLAIGLAPAARWCPPWAAWRTPLGPAAGAGLSSLGARWAAISGVALALVAPGAPALALAPARSARRGDACRTWDCGYAAPTPRMQYTASSFADGLVGLLPLGPLARGASAQSCRGCFPRRASFESHVPDPVLDRAATPSLRLDRRAPPCSAWLQAGQLHVYLLYILLTLLVLLVWMVA